MIFLEARVPMYLVGADRTRKARVQRILERLVAGEERLVTSAEVFQEILGRYSAMRRPEGSEAAFEALLGLVDETFPVELEDVVAARHEQAAYPGLSARHALHVALMRRHGVTRLVSLDERFDVVPALERIQD